MISVGRIIPSDKTRRRYIFGAIVIEHTTHTTGMWWWKEDHPSLKVRLTDEEFVRFKEILRQGSGDPDTHHTPHLEQEVEVGFRTTTERDMFAIGERVAVLFSTACAIDQFFSGAPPFRWDGLEKVG